MKELWDKIENQFSGWEVHHTGGGNFVIRKDLKDVDGNNIMVSVNDRVALIMKSKTSKEENFIDHNEFSKKEDLYWEGDSSADNIIMELENGKINKFELTKLFNNNEQDAIVKAMDDLNLILWNEKGLTENKDSKSNF